MDMGGNFMNHVIKLIAVLHNIIPSLSNKSLHIMKHLWWSPIKFYAICMFLFLMGHLIQECITISKLTENLANCESGKAVFVLKFSLACMNIILSCIAPLFFTTVNSPRRVWNLFALRTIAELLIKQGLLQNYSATSIFVYCIPPCII